MSGQSQGTPGRIPKSSPNFGKQGPMKATIPMSGILKQSSSLKSGKSPTVSPPLFWKGGTSPDRASGQRSPGASSCKVKSKSTCSDIIRRTASLDTIYLKGHWPKDNFYWPSGTLQIDKATQTDEAEWIESRKIHCISESNDKLDSFTSRPKIRGTKESNNKFAFGDNTLNTSSQTLASCMLSPTIKINPVNIPIKPLPKSSIRSSVEGLNQEIERIVLKTGSEYYSSGRNEFRHATPEGHRAPLAELFRNHRSRSVNTQTPQDFTSSCHSSGPPSRETFSPLLRRVSTDSTFSDAGESHGSSPDNETSKFGTSPHINRFLAREPPDGCEKVQLKSLEERASISLEHAPQPSTFKLKPSLGSAFHILQPDYNESREDLPLVPSQDDGLN